MVSILVAWVDRRVVDDAVVCNDENVPADPAFDSQGISEDKVYGTDKYRYEV